MTYAIQRDALTRTRQDLVVLGVRECANHYASQVLQLLVYTAQMDNAAWTNTSVTITADNAYAPDGTLTADTCVFNANGDSLAQTVGGYSVTSKAFTASVWMRIPTGTETIQLLIQNVAGTENDSVTCNLTTTWTRFWLHYLFSAVPVDDVVFMVERGLFDTATNVEIWGAQLWRNTGDEDRQIKFPTINKVNEVASDVSVMASRCSIADNGDGNRCFYSRPTCQDVDNFNAGNPWETEVRLQGIREYRFCRKDAPIALPGENVFPMLVDIPIAAQAIDPKRAVTTNERATFTFEDDEDPSLWNPQQDAEGALVNTAVGGGTLMRRIGAIYRNYGNPECYLIRKSGFVEVGGTEADYQDRQKYLVINMESTNRNIKLVCADRLKLTRKTIPGKTGSDNYIVGPIATVGPSSIFQVFSGIDISTLDPDRETVASAGAYTVTIELDYDTTAAEKCNVLDVFIGTTIGGVYGDFIIVDRGRWGTTGVTHPLTRIPFREVYEFGTERSTPELEPLGKNPIDIIIELYRYAGLKASEIDTTTLETERDTWLPSSLDITSGAHYGPLLRRTLHNVTDVETLVREIRELTLMFLWVSAGLQLTGKVFAPVLPGTTVPTITDDDNIIADSVSVNDNDESRLTRVIVAYNLPADVTEPRVAEDFAEVRAEVDVDSEEREYYGDVRTRIVLSQWIQPLDEDTAAYFTSHMLARFRHGIRVVTAQLEIQDDDIDLGDVVNLDTEHVQDAFGNNVAADAYVIKKRPVADNRFLAEFWDTGIYERVGFWSGAIADYTAATDAEKEYGYWTDDQGMVGSPLEKGYTWW